MKNIQAVKIGTTINFNIDGKLQKKICKSTEDAEKLFGLILLARKNPTDENIFKVRAFINDTTRAAMEAGLECDLATGLVYIAGFNTPIPLALVELIKDYNENGYPIEAVINFWKLLMINQDVTVRADLFDFILKHDFVLTDNGYMMTYKAVAYKDKVVNDLREFVSNQYLHVKKDWKCSPNKYSVFKDAEGILALTKSVTLEGWFDDETKKFEHIGKLGDLNAKLDQLESNVVYTDKYTHKMHIELGTPVRQARKDCDANPKKDCSNGLHVGATSYVNAFANNSDAILVCLVNPAHVIAVPEQYTSKMRVCEYFPYALATYINGKIDIIEEKYFESDYREYEEAELVEMIAKVKANELPIEAAMNAEIETRPMSELMKMLESRLVDIT
jgi:hypothetical protein